MGSKWTNDFMTYKFTGTKLEIIGLKYLNRGKADIYINDVLQQEIDCYASTFEWQAPIYTQTWLTEEERTLKIVVKGTHSINATDNWVDVDAFDVTSGGIVTRQECCNGRWFGTFTGYRHANYSFGSSMGAKDNSAFCSYSFTGSKIEWITLKYLNRGIADVYIDDVKEATVDCYATDFQWQAVAFSRSWPTSGSHTIKIVVTGTKSHTETGTDTWVDIDAFDVTP
jgi:hypothetical protein